MLLTNYMYLHTYNVMQYNYIWLQYVVYKCLVLIT